MNMNLLAFVVDITSINESMDSLKNIKKINFINRLKYAEQKIFCISVGVNKIQESNDYDTIYELFQTLKNKN